MPCSKDWLYTFVNALYIYSQAYLTHLIGVPIVDLFPFKITIKSRTSYSCMGEKKWVSFVAMQQNSETLIYDLNTMKGTMESYLKRIA